MRDSSMIVNHEGQSENLLGMVVNREEEAYKLYSEEFEFGKNGV